MKLYLYPTLLMTTLILSACGSTLEGFQRDFGNMTTSINNKIGDLKTTDATSPKAQELKSAAFDGGCPSISVDPQLDSITEFYDLEKPSDATMVSVIKLIGTQSECSTDAEFLTMRVDLSFEGSLGPKARRKNSDRPFFAYPYFIAVNDGQGNELAREIFAASVTYTAKQNEMTLIETIRQKLPLNDDGSVPPYQVQIGFQLTEDQLFYNASL